MSTQPNKNFAIGLDAGWNFPQGIDPGSNRHLDQLMTQAVPGGDVLGYEQAKMIVEAYRSIGDKAGNPALSIDLSSSIEQAEVDRGILERGVCDVSANGDICFRSPVSSAVSEDNIEFVQESMGLAKLLSDHWERLNLYPDGMFSMAYVTPYSEVADEILQQVEDDGYCLPHEYDDYGDNAASIALVFKDKNLLDYEQFETFPGENLYAITCEGATLTMRHGKYYDQSNDLTP